MSCIPDSEKTEAMFRLYCDGHSLSQVAVAFAVSRQSVFTRFKRAGKAMRSTLKLPFIMFGGVKYTRRSNGYYARTDGVRSFLHRDVWIAAHGPIPADHDIHHRNEDRADNALSNLQLISKSDHTKLHGFRGNQHTKCRAS